MNKKSIVYGLWYGGSSYAMFDQFNKSDILEFESIAAAQTEFEDRRNNAFNVWPRTPCVNNEAEMWLTYDDPFEVPDLYPEWIISINEEGLSQIWPA